MFEHGCIVMGIHIWEGMRSAIATQQQGVAGTVVTGIIGIGRGTNQTTIGVLAMTCRDTFRDDGRAVSGRRRDIPR